MLRLLKIDTSFLVMQEEAGEYSPEKRSVLNAILWVKKERCWRLISLRRRLATFPPPVWQRRCGIMRLTCGRRYLTKSIEFKSINETEMADLFGFFYIMRYMDEPGDPAKGKEVLRYKRCTECHGTGEKRQKVGPDLEMWAEFTNPILWVQMMWNHAPKMKKEMEKMSIPWPKLGGSDIVDIIAYIRSLKPSEEKVFLAPGDPAEGKRLFSQEGCIQCHAIRGKGRNEGP